MAVWRVTACAALCVLLAETAPGLPEHQSQDGLLQRLAGSVRIPRSDSAPNREGPAMTSDDLLSDELGRKKKKNNTTVGEEVLSAIIDGITGESEDAAFGSDIRKQFGYLISAVTKFGQTAATEYDGNEQTRKAEEKKKCAEAADKCSGGGRAAMEHVGEGRRRQVRRLLVRYIVLLKVFALGIILPGAVLLALLQSWKAVTVSLMALLLAVVIGVRGLVTTAAKQPAEVIHTAPGSHYWRRVSQDQQQDADKLAYGGYMPFS